MRYNFDQIFTENQNGQLTPIRPVNINGVTFGPGVSFGPGVLFGGLNIFDYKNNAIEGDEEDGVIIIRGFYTN